VIQLYTMIDDKTFTTATAARIIAAHSTEERTVFVFPTGVAADAWADWAITHEKISGVHALAMDRFIAWDDFKSASIKNSITDKKSIPAVLRSIFSQILIAENSMSPFFKELIPPQYASKASGYAEWITSLLPSLAGWKKRFIASREVGDKEDNDLMLLYQKYQSFLDKNQLFDPAWETPPFIPDGSTYYLFYPEVLMDFSEYHELLTDQSATAFIHLVTLQKTDAEIPPPVTFYENSRAELRHLCLNLIKLHDNDHINWDEIAISINDIETYAPYVTRDFSLYHIPFVLRHGLSLTKNGAGSLFQQIQTCNAENFSFTALRALLKNSDIPWKEKQGDNGQESALNNALVQFGIEHNCICSYEQNGQLIDCWELSFKSSPQQKSLFKYYNDLKKAIQSLTHARSFHEIRKQYFAFRTQFIAPEHFTESNNQVIQRCITELSNLEDIEKSFPDCQCPDPFSFFVQILSSKIYLAQNDIPGVQIFPYKLASTAPFACHIVLDASEASSTIVFRQFNFLRDDKRKKLGIEDNNPSQFFIRLYTLNSYHSAHFSAAEKTFTGYALPYSGLTEINYKDIPSTSANKADPYFRESLFFEGNGDLPDPLTEIQKNGLLTWNTFTRRSARQDKIMLPDVLQSRLHETIYTDERIRLSETSLSLFFTCPRLWLLKKGLKISERTDEASLIDSAMIGNLQHAILCSFLSSIKLTRQPLSDNSGRFSPEYKILLTSCIEKEMITCHASPLARELIQTLKRSISDTLERALLSFCRWFSGCKVFATEQPYTVKPAQEEYLLHGIIDCLLSTSDGSILLIDFKSGSGPAKKTWYITENNDKPDFQMPMYLTLLEKQNHPIYPSCAVFFSLKDAKPFVVTGSLNTPDGKTISGEDFTTTLTAFNNFVTICADKIARNNFSLPPDVTYETCSACPYRTICRQTFTISGERS
jgi:hypothetical protein